jgi:sugar lactone lactonase YvrE/DNA-binding IclR family transcriptional regulator
VAIKSQSTEQPHGAAEARGLGVLEKAMSLLSVVSDARRPLTFTELWRASSLPKATLHRILATLVREGLLRHDAYTRSFSLGFRLLELAHEVWSDFDLRVAAQDELLRLRDALGESVQLVVPDGTHAVVLAHEPAAREPQPLSVVGQRLPLTDSAAGRAILAGLDPARRAALLASLGRDDDAELGAALDLARAAGYAVTQGSVAAPIFDVEGRAIGAVSASATLERLPPARAHGLSAALIGAARAVTHNAGGKPMSIAPRDRPADAPTAELHCVDAAGALLGEGPMWSARDDALYWVDILAPAIHVFFPAERRAQRTPLGSMASLVLPKASGGVLVATPAGLMAAAAPDAPFVPFAHPAAGRSGQRYNDGKCDRRGRLWIGSMDMAAAPNRGLLHRVDADGSHRTMDSGFTVPNGLGWSPDNRRMYFTDTFRQTVYEYDFDLDAGTIAQRRALVSFDAAEGKPDGLTVDAEGCLWIAMWDAWELVRVSPRGERLQRVRVPVPRPTSCCFGGTALQTLYVTSASVRLGEAELAAAPQSGALFAMEMPGVRGLPETIFAG